MSTTETVWFGAEELRTFIRPLESLTPHPQNPRRGDVDLVASSLMRFGQLKPIITDRDAADEIVAGNHTYLAARELGWTHVAAVQMWAEADEGMKYLLIDNRTSDNSTYDREELLALLDRYQGDELAATGFTDAEREQIRADLEADRKAAEEFAAGAAEPERPRDDEQPRPGTIVRNVLLTWEEPDSFREFTTRLNVLRREWGIVDVSLCIAEAVRRETQRLHREG